MRKWIALGVAGLAALAVQASAATLEDLGRQSAEFYLAPTPEAFEALQQGLDEHQAELVGAKGSGDLLAAVEVARIAQKHGWKPGEGYFGCLAQEILDGRTERARLVADDSRVDPTRLDIWWASFYGTGEAQYLEKILQYAGQPLPRGDVAKLLVIGAASWSFTSNCAQFARVRDFARSKLADSSLPEPRRKYLGECVAGAAADGRK